MDQKSILEQVLEILRARQAELHRRGIQHAAVFGSVARGDARPDSDVDVLVDLDYQNTPSAWEYVELGMDLQTWLGREVHLAVRTNLHPYIRPEAERDAVYAF